eukprot:gene1012-3907_t
MKGRMVLGQHEGSVTATRRDVILPVDRGTLSRKQRANRRANFHKPTRVANLSVVSADKNKTERWHRQTWAHNRFQHCMIDEHHFRTAFSDTIPNGFNCANPQQ